ncbi:hypothetical protein AB1Y20_015191 [Prymnesium parvum]|uniref:Chromo domain-containing protein n=1 Tax=Prymnesium parvum TaxID=97485 RepID=A0AB34K034_PRYPA
MERLGPITSDKAYAVAKERALAKEEARKAKEARSTSRAQKKSVAELSYVETYNDIKTNLATRQGIKQLSVAGLKSVLHCVDSMNKGKHKELKNKKAVLEYVLGLYPDIPEGEPQQLRHACVRRVQRPAEDDMDESNSSEDESEEEESEGEESEYELEEFVDACKRGNSYMLRVRWAGYSANQDTWEPIAEMRKTQNDRVEEFIIQRKCDSKWPPTMRAAVGAPVVE